MQQRSWKYCQDSSDRILAEGLELLRQSPPSSLAAPDTPGNYLISSGDDLAYIGEAKDLRSRLRQQLAPRTSTFYKNYLEYQQMAPSARMIEISHFEVRHLSVHMGRKELEEFGIVCLPARLNRFQLGKRSRFVADGTKLWHDVQAATQDLLEQGELMLLDAPSAGWFSATVPLGAGLYHVEHPREGLVYIGESSGVRERYQTHGANTYFSALRRNLGENLLGFSLQTRNGKRRYFSPEEDALVTRFLGECRVRSLAVSFGRMELEEYLIRKHGPLLNRKENRSR